jgi:hypothetical protein
MCEETMQHTETLYTSVDKLMEVISKERTKTISIIPKDYLKTAAR